MLIIAAGAILLTQCKKDGATGPAGPAGAIGNANVTQQTFTVSTWSSYYGVWQKPLIIPALNSKALLGEVEVFYSTGSQPGVWNPLPATFNQGGISLFDFNTRIDTLTLTFDDGGGNPPNTFFPGGATMQVNVVIIPPAMRKPNVNHHNYSEVQAAYGLKD
jgi:hypothetical protein